MTPKKDFHFIVTQTLITKLKPFARTYGKSVNMLIVEILELSFNYVNKIYLSAGNQKTKYERVTSLYETDPLTDPRIEIHIYMREKLYEKIKLLHGRRNNFSLAQIVRRCMVFYLEGVREYGSIEKFESALNKLEKKTRSQYNLTFYRNFIKSYPHFRQLDEITIVTLDMIKLFIEYLSVL